MCVCYFVCCRDVLMPPHWANLIFRHVKVWREDGDKKINVSIRVTLKKYWCLQSTFKMDRIDKSLLNCHDGYFSLQDKPCSFYLCLCSEICSAVKELSILKFYKCLMLCLIMWFMLTALPSFIRCRYLYQMPQACSVAVRRFTVTYCVFNLSLQLYVIRLQLNVA